MSVLPVCRVPSIDVGPASHPAEQVAQSGRPSLAVLTGASSASRTDTSPTSKSRPGMFGSFKRPSFLKRRTNSSDDKSAFGSNGASLKRWTSDSSSVLSPGAESPSMAPRIGDFDGPPTSGRGFFSEQGRSANVPACILEDQTLETERDTTANQPLLKSPIMLEEGDRYDKYTRLRACCPQCSRATDKGLSDDWVPPVSKRAQKKLDVEHMVRQIEGKRLSEEEMDDAVDEKASSFCVDEVELLRRRRSSGGSFSQETQETQETSPERKPVSQTCLLGIRPSSRSGSASPSNGPIWLCSGKGRSPSSGSFSRQSPANTPGRATPERRSADYFSLARQDAAAAQAAREELDAKIAAALSAEASLARESARERETPGDVSPSNEMSGNSSRRGDWFRRMAEGGGVISV